MTYDANTPVVNVAPRISKAAFVAWLQSAKSPAAASGSDGYDAIVANKVDPLFCLACFNHESNAATNPAAVVVKYGTNNPGNCRSTRTGAGHVINTERGPFVAYPNWYEGWRDLAFRLIDPTYDYVKEGRTTPGTIVPKFAPESDGNDPDGYLQSVLTFMNQHADLKGDTAPVATADDSAATWQPSPNFGSGRNGKTIDFIIIHTTEGTYDSALGWLRNPASQASCTYLASADGQRVAQLVREADTSWAAGNLDFNRRGINIEQEGYAAKGGFSDGLYQTMGALVGRIAKRHNVPLEYTGKTGKRGIIGHMDVPDGKGGWGGESHHGDPGSQYDFAKLIAIAKGQPATPAKPMATSDTYTDPVTGYKIIGGMLARWNQLKAALASISPDEVVLVVGRPVGDERVDPDGVTRQDFERATWSWMPGKDPSRFDILADIVNPYKAGK